MKHFFLLIVSIIIASSYNVNAQERQIEDFNFDWYFKLGDDTQFATKDFDDSSWRELHLPHDWSIEGEFSKDNPSTPGGGALPGGIGWYRKHFRSPKLDGRHIAIEFDGIFMNSTVFVNGHKVGFRPYGYSSMSYEITPYLNPQGEENIIAVRCDNSEQPNSRWYAGCGIYRNVRLVNTANVFVDYTGTYITTPEISKERGTIKAQVSISNLRNEASKVTLENKILDAKGRCVAKNSVTKAINAGASADMEMTIEVNNPILWDVDNPYLYNVVSYVMVDGKVVDDYITPFGFRYFEFKADTGFWLNGRNLKLKGVCMHHDLGALGTAVHRRGLERQLDILQSFGVNAIRTSHNPPTPELLDMCDERGILVMDEAFDMWRRAKTRYDYARYFDEWHQKDLIDFIKRDRNHPSIVMWSVGNEILEQWNSNDDVKLDDLPAEQRNLLINFISENATGNKDDVEKNTNVLLTRHMVATLKKYDNTRPVTAGCNETRPTNNLIRSGALDIIGFNYHVQDYDSVKEWYPNMPFIGSETASSLNSRGFYIHPSTKINVVPERWDAPHQTDHHQCSAYDNSRAPWATLHEEAWVAVRDRDFCAGTFIWTGFDYLGEPTPYSWPSRSSYFGIVDLCGFPKDCYYMYRSEWTNNPTLHLFPHWNWNVGDKIDMWVYYNTADEVELFLNGKSLGKRTKTSDRLHAIWENVEFEAGEITAIGYKNGKEILRHSRKTAGKAEKIVLTADRKVLKADGYDLAYVTVECTDAKGNLVPTAMNQLYFEIDGVGELVGVDNGNAAGGESLKGNKMKLFNGKAIAIVRTKRNESGKITLKVTSDDMESATVKLSSR